MEEIRIICNKNKGMYTVLLFIQRVRVSYIVAHHVILNSLSKLWKNDLMRDTPTILTFIFATTLINSKIQFQEMNAHVSLCKSVDSPESLLPAYSMYKCRPELRPHCICMDN